LDIGRGPYNRINMAHMEQMTFISVVADFFALKEPDRRILEIGSYDLNGSVRKFFPADQAGNYVGVDLCEGPGVDVVGFGHELSFPEESFDVTLSCECFEHDPHWARTFANMNRMTKADGVVAFTCASLGRLEHGTSRTEVSSPGTQSIGIDYYRNLSQADFENRLPLKDMFAFHYFYYNRPSQDLYFVGLKKKVDIGRFDIERFKAEVKRISRLTKFRPRIWEVPVYIARRVCSDQRFQDFAIKYLSAVKPYRQFLKSLSRR
jgi:SAM-dependent methyltransferase